MNEQPVGKFSTIIERETFEIVSRKHPGGKVYEFVNAWDLGPIQHAVFVDRANLAHTMREKKKLTPAQEAQLHKALGDVCKILLPGLEPAVLAEMKTSHRSAILFTWIALNEQKQAETGEAPGNRRSRRTGSKSSRGSKSSTAATPRGGSTSRHGS